MRFLCLLIAAGTVLASSGAAQTPTALRKFDQATVERLGRSLHRHDRAAWIATDALLKRFRSPQAAGVAGWIVVEQGDADLVRFVRSVEGRLEAAYDVRVTARGAATVAEPADRTLTATEQAAFSARAAAAGAVAQVCRPGYNTVVLPDVDGDGWLVWLLAPTPKVGVLPIGGHYRVTVAADGRTVEQADKLFATCLLIDPSQGAPAGAKVAMAVASDVVSEAPQETHVFVQLQSRLTLYVMTARNGLLWKVQNGAISRVERPAS